jgi:hypothetical protein
MWNIKKIVSKGVYNYALVPEHPFCTKNGYVLHHRVVVENHLGRLLNADEVVHHINDDKKNNSLCNLRVMSKSEHARMHGHKMKLFVILKCPWCGDVFIRERRQTHLVKPPQRYTTCSRSCRGSLSRALQLSRETHKLEMAISENIQEYHWAINLSDVMDNSEQTADNGMRRDYTPST